MRNGHDLPLIVVILYYCSILIAGIHVGDRIIMNVTILGAGRMARAITERLISGGHSVQILARSRGKAEALAEDFSRAGELDVVSWGKIGDAPDSDVVVLAVPYNVADSLLKYYGERLAAKIVVDITNPLNDTKDDIVTKQGPAGVEHLAMKAPAGAAVVKAFNTTFAKALTAGEVGGHSLDVFLVGDDLEAKGVVAKLVEDGGLRAIDVGGLDRAHLLEALGLLHILLQRIIHTGFESSVKVLSADAS